MAGGRFAVAHLFDSFKNTGQRYCVALSGSTGVLEASPRAATMIE
jgi:hypothetical protein